jgi:hypothetical protein
MGPTSLILEIFRHHEGSRTNANREWETVHMAFVYQKKS